MAAVEVLTRYRVVVEDKENIVKPLYGFVTKPEREVWVKLSKVPESRKHKNIVTQKVGVAFENIQTYWKQQSGNFENDPHRKAAAQDTDYSSSTGLNSESISME